jgi:hypothetical protein
MPDTTPSTTAPRASARAQEKDPARHPRHPGRDSRHRHHFHPYLRLEQGQALAQRQGERSDRAPVRDPRQSRGAMGSPSAAAWPKADRHLRDWLPWPHLIANDVHVGNPASMKQATWRACASSRSRSIRSPCCTTRSTSRCCASTARMWNCCAPTATHYNWVYKNEDKKSKWELDLERVVLTDGVVHVNRRGHQGRRHGPGAHPRQRPEIRHRLQGRGSYNGAPVTGGGKVGQVLSLKDQDTPYPVQADMRSGPSPDRGRGHGHQPAKLKAVDLQLKLAGRSMARCTTSRKWCCPRRRRSRPRAT